MNILIVDDDPSSRKFLKVLIESHGHSVIEAPDGQEGLERALEHKPDAIVSDAVMPKMDGFQFLRAVRQEETLRTIPFVFYTGIYTDDKEYALALSYGADALIVKPKAPADFWKEFNSALDSHASKEKQLLQTRLTERDEDLFREYCRIVAAKLEEKVRDLEMVIADHEQTKAILRENEQRYRNLVDNAQDVIFSLDSEGALVSLNPVFETMTGWSRAESIGQNFTEFVHPDDLSIAVDRFLGVMKGESPDLYVLRILHKSGYYMHGEFLVWPNLRGGNTVGLSGIARDITERIHLDDALKAAVVRAENEKAKTDSIIAAIGDGITIQDTAFRILYQNQAAIKMMGNHVGELCYKAYEKREQRCEGCPVAMVFEDGGIHTTIRTVPTDKGTMIFENTASPLRDSKGNIVAGIEVIHDITKRRQTEKTMHKMQDLLNETGKIAKIGGWEFDSGTMDLIWTEEVYRIHELDRTYRPTVSEAVAFYVPAARPVIELAVQRAIDYGETFDEELEIITSKGNSRWVHAIGHAHQEHGKTKKVFGVIQDITERKIIERQLHERVHQAALVADIGIALTQGRDLHTTLQLCAEAIVRQLDAAFARIWTLNDRENILEMQASAGMYTHLNGPHGHVPVGQFKIGLIAEERKPHLTNQVVGDPRIGDQEWAIKEGMAGFAGYPLIVQARLVGVIAMFSRKKIPEATMSSLASIADVIALGIERKRSEEALDLYSRELTSLSMASDTLLLVTNLKDIYTEICEIAYSVFDVKMVWLGLIEEDTYVVKPVAYSGREDGYLSSITVTWDDSPAGMGPVGRAIKSKAIFKENIDDPSFAPWKQAAQERGYSAIIAIPLIYARDKCLGVLNFYSDTPDYFTPDRMKLCQIFANQAAIAIENAGLIEELADKVQKRTRSLEDANRELNALNQELVVRRIEADAASRSKTDFLANMSHELRTPLNSIMGFSDIMRQGMAGPVTDKQKEFLSDISTSGEHLLTLINEILDLSKIEAGKLELELGTVSLKEIIESSLSMFKEKALKHNIRVISEIDVTITSIIADQRKLKQVLVNLLSNAFKFTPDGGSVSVSARKGIRDQGLGIEKAGARDLGFGIGEEKLSPKPQPPTPDRDFVEISVTDTGIGISIVHQQKLFQSFQQIETSLTRKYAGTGLGLSLCRRLVELHGGRIWVESEPGKGSKFTFIIPVEQ